jgi:hypothetical protein
VAPTASPTTHCNALTDDNTEDVKSLFSSNSVSSVTPSSATLVSFNVSVTMVVNMSDINAFVESLFSASESINFNSAFSGDMLEVLNNNSVSLVGADESTRKLWESDPCSRWEAECVASVALAYAGIVAGFTVHPVLAVIGLVEAKHFYSKCKSDYFECTGSVLSFSLSRLGQFSTETRTELTVTFPVGLVSSYYGDGTQDTSVLKAYAQDALQLVSANVTNLPRFAMAFENATGYKFSVQEANLTVTSVQVFGQWTASTDTSTTDANSNSMMVEWMYVVIAVGGFAVIIVILFI